MSLRGNGPRWAGSSRNQELPPDWNQIRSQVLEDDDYICQLMFRGCLGTASEVDHIQRGNDHRRENLRAVCKPCHAKKSSREGNARRSELRSRRFRTERHPGIL